MRRTEGGQKRKVVRNKNMSDKKPAKEGKKIERRSRG